MNIYVCGIIGYSKAVRLLEENREVCARRLPAFFIKQFEQLKEQYKSVAAAGAKLENTLAEQPGGPTIIKLGEGGLYHGLWELGVELGCGIEADILKVSVSQEVVEIMELTNADPYEADSEGCFLIAAEDSAGLFEDEDINLTCIGVTTKSKARIVKMPEGIRYLTPPARQEKDMRAKKNDRVGK